MHIIVKITVGCVALCILYVLLFGNILLKKNIEGLADSTEDSSPTSESSFFSTTIPDSSSSEQLTTTDALPDTVPANSAPVAPLDITAEQFYILKHALAMMKPVYVNPTTNKAFCVSVIDSIGISAAEITSVLGNTNINSSIKMANIEKLVAQHGQTIGKITDISKLPPYTNTCGTYTYSTI